MLELLLSGGATGILGNLFTSIMGVVKMHQARLDRQLENAHELRLQQMQLESMKHETERETMIAESKAQSAAFVASVEHDRDMKPSQWVVDIRGLFRPFITLLLVLLTGFVYLYAIRS